MHLTLKEAQLSCLKTKISHNALDCGGFNLYHDGLYKLKTGPKIVQQQESSTNIVIAFIKPEIPGSFGICTDEKSMYCVNSCKTFHMLL
jgi:hypothetical protein